MRYNLIKNLLAIIFLISLSGCSSSELFCTKDDMTTLLSKVDRLESSLTTLKDHQQQNEKNLNQLALKQPVLFKDLKNQITKVQLDQNKTNLIIKNKIPNKKPKKVVVYKKETPKFNDKFVVGQEEVVLIEPPTVQAKARVDTGADTSSLDARDIEEFERDGKKWVKFNFVDQKTNKKHTVETKVSRHVRIIQSSLPDKTEKRIVVKLKVTIGEFSDLAEFTLTDREHMEFPVLIGRNILKDIALVDVGKKNIAPLKNDIK